MIGAAARRNGEALAKYLIVGGLAALVEWGVFGLLLHYARLHYLLAALIAFVVATLANYALGMKLLFVSKSGSVPKDVAMVFVASLLGLGVNLLTLGVLISRFAVNPIAAKIAATGAAFLVNFAARQFVIFGGGKRDLPDLFDGGPPSEEDLRASKGTQS
jgi:putative flippase GtrA